MEQLKPFSDDRLRQSCVYCRGGLGTSDHVPSKVFLDEPYPENLPTVSACAGCNAGFSRDEEYVACLLDVVVAGSADPEAVSRLKVSRILREKTLLRDMLARARQHESDQVTFEIDAARVRNVVLKLARGHAAFELDEYRAHEPTSVSWSPLAGLDPESRDRFETPPITSLLPEVGSRGMQRMAIVSVQLVSPSDPTDTHEHRFLLGPDWIEVQAGRYRYLAALLDGGSLIVRFVLSEYLACEVIWS